MSKLLDFMENDKMNGPKAKAEVRLPWPDEMPRVHHFLPSGFLFDPEPFVLVAVSGRVERLVGVVALTRRPTEEISANWLYLRVENEHPVGAELLQRALDEAWTGGAESVHFGQTIDEDSPTAAALEQAGFSVTAVHEVYEVDSVGMGQRLDRIYQRLRARNLIPSDIELTTLQPVLLPKVREFLIENFPSSASALALETAGYRAAHSFALLQDGVVKGVLLSRRAGRVAHVGLRVVAEELRGGLGWANLVLLHASMLCGLQTGLEVSRFEFNPQQHQDTKQFAEINRAQLVGRRLLLKVDNPAKKSLTVSRPPD